MCNIISDRRWGWGVGFNWGNTCLTKPDGLHFCMSNEWDVMGYNFTELTRS